VAPRTDAKLDPFYHGQGNSSSVKCIEEYHKLGHPLVMPGGVVYKKSMSGLLIMTGLGSVGRISGSALGILFILKNARERVSERLN
jgi:hypothetical protein